jgi:hypothetical protein
LLIHAGLFGVFRKAGKQGWEAFVPGFNLWVWLKWLKVLGGGSFYAHSRSEYHDVLGIGFLDHAKF